MFWRLGIQTFGKGTSVKRYLISALFFLQSVSWATTSETLFIPEDLDPKKDFIAKDLIEREQFQSDLDTLEYAFRFGYGGWALHGTMIEKEIFPSLRNLERKQISSQQACSLIGAALDKIPDKHISVLLAQGSSYCAKTSERKPTVGSNIKPIDDKPWAYFERARLFSYPPRLYHWSNSTLPHNQRF
jgi:hypothetical protein